MVTVSAEWRSTCPSNRPLGGGDSALPLACASRAAPMYSEQRPRRQSVSRSWLNTTNHPAM